MKYTLFYNLTELEQIEGKSHEIHGGTSESMRDIDHIHVLKHLLQWWDGHAVQAAGNPWQRFNTQRIRAAMVDWRGGELWRIVPVWYTQFTCLHQKGLANRRQGGFQHLAYRLINLLHKLWLSAFQVPAAVQTWDPAYLALSWTNFALEVCPDSPASRGVTFDVVLEANGVFVRPSGSPSHPSPVFPGWVCLFTCNYGYIWRLNWHGFPMVSPSHWQEVDPRPNRDGLAIGFTAQALGIAGSWRSF